MGAHWLCGMCGAEEIVLVMYESAGAFRQGVLRGARDEHRSAEGVKGLRAGLEGSLSLKSLSLAWNGLENEGA
eukprot:scaffold320370_cov19-Tisochrysis_lutea.AAC.1